MEIVLAVFEEIGNNIFMLESRISSRLSEWSRGWSAGRLQVTVGIYGTSDCCTKNLRITFQDQHETSLQLVVQKKRGVSSLKSLCLVAAERGLGLGARQVAALHLPHTLKTELKDEVHSCWSSKRRPRITVTSHLVRARNQEARGL